MAIGKLRLINKKSLQIQWINSKGKTVNFNIKESELSSALKDRKDKAITQLDGLEVEFDEVGGQPKQIREKNQQFTNSSSARGDFHNPYNFVPALPRNTESVKSSELGDRTPIGHGCYQKGYWSGKISVSLTTVTPLLIPDAAKATDDEHKIYPIRLGLDGKPYLPPTSVKGMLRSAYEAVTNSRLSIFSKKHENRLAYRMPAKTGDLVPARVECRDDKLVLRIMEKTELLGNAGKLPRYQAPSSQRDKGESTAAIKYDGSNQLPQHGDKVSVRLNNGVVTRIKKWTPNPAGSGDWLKGWVCITGANIRGKKYERVFIESDENEIIPVTDEMKLLWKELISNYQETHEKDLENRRKDSKSPQDYLGNEPGKTAWSRHVYLASEVELKEGTLCYVEFLNNKVNALIPVSISRRLYNISPHELLDISLQPAINIKNLSPADRVFGWVNQKGHQNGQGSYKGQIRIPSVKCDSEDAIQPFEEGLPLAILGEPKPQQSRFYVAKNCKGEPVPNETEKADGYQEGQGLRGRKIYPHHRQLPSDYWNTDSGTLEVENQYREYLRPDHKQDSQNRTIEAWVKPNSEFTFDIEVINLSLVELGALLWILSLPDDCYHRLGGGKPLGFGSVNLKINWDKTDLRKGEDWRKFYSSLDVVTHTVSRETEAFIQNFKDTVVEVYGNQQKFEEIHFIKAFCRCAQGFDDKKPIHYPRKRQHPGQNPVPPHPEGKAFEWFVENERIGKNAKPPVSLPALWDDQGLPLLP